VGGGSGLITFGNIAQRVAEGFASIEGFASVTIQAY
jgi:hypothetical protein